jgi:hypothetical protein
LYTIIIGADVTCKRGNCRRNLCSHFWYSRVRWVKTLRETTQMTTSDVLCYWTPLSLFQGHTHHQHKDLQAREKYHLSLL